jgi:hypothetical protein
MEVRLPNSSFVQVGGRQERFFWRVPVPGDDGHGAQRGMDPVDQVQAPIGRIQPDDARTQPVEAHGPFEQGAGKGAIMGIGGPDQEVHGQARTTTQQRMHPIASQERTRMVSRRVTQGGIGIGAAPRQDGSTINDQIAGADQSATHGAPDREHKEGLKEWGCTGYLAHPFAKQTTSPTQPLYDLGMELDCGKSGNVFISLLQRKCLHHTRKTGACAGEHAQGNHAVDAR